MKSNILRWAMAAAIGIIVAFALLWLAQYAGSEIAPAEYDVDTGEILIPLGSTIALIVGWFVGTFGGAWLAMRLAAGSGPGWVVAGAVVGAALYSAADFSDGWWIMALGVMVPLAAAWIAQRAAGAVEA